MLGYAQVYVQELATCAVIDAVACRQEIALLQNTKRNATVVTAEESEFLIVDRDDFIANDIHLKMNDEFKYRVDFYRY